MGDDEITPRDLDIARELASIGVRLTNIEQRLEKWARCRYLLDTGECALAATVTKHDEWIWQAKGVLLAVSFLSAIVGAGVVMVVKWLTGTK